MKLKECLIELRKGKKRKFDQSVDLIINLKGVDLRKETVNVVASVSHKVKEKRVCGFLENKSELVKSISKIEFPKYKDKNVLRKLVKKYDFFIAEAPLMPAVATTFGKVLGPAGKMPSPQLGIMPQSNDAAIKSLLERIDKSIKVRAKEASVKLIIGGEEMKDEELIENATQAYKAVVKALPKKEENVKNVLLKFTMTKPIKVEIK